MEAAGFGGGCTAWHRHVGWGDQRQVDFGQGKQWWSWMSGGATCLWRFVGGRLLWCGGESWKRSFFWEKNLP
jgi:hypothetical protein